MTGDRLPSPVLVVRIIIISVAFFIRKYFAPISIFMFRPRRCNQNAISMLKIREVIVP